MLHCDARTVTNRHQPSPPVTAHHYMYNKLFTKILDSSIWLAPDPVRLVWITLIAAMDEDGNCMFACAANVAARARVTVEQAEQALAAFEAPDRNSGDPENEGRRIERIPGGWHLLNAHKYRAMVTKAIIREQTRQRTAKYRQRDAHVTHCDASERKSDVSVTPSGALAEAEEKKETTMLSHGSDRPSAEPQDSLASDAKTKGLPECPHLEILALWAEVLPAMPQHEPELWKGQRADHLRARWRETAVAKKWATRDQGMVYMRRFFGYVAQSKFLMGRVKSSTPDRPAFSLTLAWLVKPENWSKTVEGAYNIEEA